MGDVNIGDKEEVENRRERARGHGVLDPRSADSGGGGLVGSSGALAEELKDL